MKQEQRTETYTAYKTENVTEARTVTKMVSRPVTETVMETRTTMVRKPVTETHMVTKTVTERVPVTKTVTVNETHYVTQQVTEMQSKVVKHTSNVSEEINLGPSILDRFKAFGHDVVAQMCERLLAGAVPSLPPSPCPASITTKTITIKTMHPLLSGVGVC